MKEKEIFSKQELDDLLSAVIADSAEIAQNKPRVS